MTLVTQLGIICWEHLLHFSNTSSYPHKTVILGTTMLFSCSSSSSIPISFFGGHQYFLISPQRKGRYNSPNTMGIIPTTTFQSYFLLHFCGTCLLYGYWRRYIGVLLQQLPQYWQKMILGYPNTCILGKDYWGTAGDALRDPSKSFV